jgi:hypothetical protein
MSMGMVRCFGSAPPLCLVFALWTALPLRAQDLEAADVRVTLDSALRIADRVAAAAFPDLSNYILYSITPRSFKADPGGLLWQVRWQARAFPHRQWIVVRVYMKDGHTTAEREDETPGPSPGQAAPPRQDRP